MNKIEELIKDWETNEIIDGINCVLVIEQSSMKKFKQDLQSLINSAVEEERERMRNAITTGVKKYIEGHCAWFKIDNQTFMLNKCITDEVANSEESAEWYLKCMNTAFDKLKVLKE